MRSSLINSNDTSKQHSTWKGIPRWCPLLSDRRNNNFNFANLYIINSYSHFRKWLLFFMRRACKLYTIISSQANFIERCQPVHISKPFFFSAKHHNYTQFTLTSSREILGQSVQIAKEYMVVSSLCFADQSNRQFRVVDWEWQLWSIWLPVNLKKSM